MTNYEEPTTEKDFNIDCAEILAEYADIDMDVAIKLITDYEMDLIIEKMYEAQAEQISYLAERYQRGEL